MNPRKPEVVVGYAGNVVAVIRLSSGLTLSRRPYSKAAPRPKTAGSDTRGSK